MYIGNYSLYCSSAGPLQATNSFNNCDLDSRQRIVVLTAQFVHFSSYVIVDDTGIKNVLYFEFVTSSAN